MDNSDQRNVPFVAALNQQRNADHAAALSSMAPELETLSPDVRAQVLAAIYQDHLGPASQAEALSPAKLAALNSVASGIETLSPDVQAKLWAAVYQDHLGPASHEAGPQGAGVRTELDERTRDTHSR